MVSTAVRAKYTPEALLLTLAREIAQDINTIESILEQYRIPASTWEKIKDSPRFQAILQRELAVWNSAQNTNERVKIKSGAIVEESLSNLHVELNNNQTPLTARTELLKTLTRLAGMGLEKAEVAGAGERFTVTINMGADNQLKFEKDLKVVSPTVIDG
jgi:hypothetical protein